jgi:CopG antitoxin of type II toxin-antitoxin system
MTMPPTTRGFTPIHSFDEVPSFSSEEEEAQFWATHELSSDLLSTMKPIDDGTLPPARPRTKPVSLRFDEDTLERARALASHRNMGYQTLLKNFIMERLYEEEKREGLAHGGHSRTAWKRIARADGRSSTGLHPRLT